MKPSIRIFDNGGETLDQYTVIINGSVYGMSCNARSPQGFNQYCCEFAEISKNIKNLGEEIPLLDAPLEVRLAIGDRLKAD